MLLSLLSEKKSPPDSRVVLTPRQCREVMRQYPGINIQVESSADRCFSDDEYRAEGIAVSIESGHADILIGVKEVPVTHLIPDKTYFFFSHTIKGQVHNMKLLRAVLANKIRLIDHETLVDEGGVRVIAFGRYAGIVGAHNALWAWGQLTGRYSLPRAYQLKDKEALYEVYKGMFFPPVKIVITGAGRVGRGAIETLEAAGIKRVGRETFLEEDMPTEPVYYVADSADFYRLEEGKEFDMAHFVRHPQHYSCHFSPFYRAADIMINAIYWDKRAPAFFTRDEMTSPAFRLRLIADITCDIAPESSLPSTLRAATIADPLFGYNPHTAGETDPFSPESIAVMAIDNLPNELPRDASEAFGEQFIAHVIPALLASGHPMIDRATIAENGNLTPRFSYLTASLNL